MKSFWHELNKPKLSWVQFLIISVIANFLNLIPHISIHFK